MKIFQLPSFLVSTKNSWIGFLIFIFNQNNILLQNAQNSKILGIYNKNTSWLSCILKNMKHFILPSWTYYSNLNIFWQSNHSEVQTSISKLCYVTWERWMKKKVRYLHFQLIITMNIFEFLYSFLFKLIKKNTKN